MTTFSSFEPIPQPVSEVFQNALIDHWNLDTLKKLNEAKKAKKDTEKHEYFDQNLEYEEQDKALRCQFYYI